jgi:hypothetical protein
MVGLLALHAILGRAVFTGAVKRVLSVALERSMAAMFTERDAIGCYNSEQ